MAPAVFDDALAALRTDLATLREQVESADASVAEGLEEGLAKLGTRLDGFEARLDGLPPSVAPADFDDALAALRTDLTALREQVESADAEVKALTAMLDTERSNENLTTEGRPTSELFGLSVDQLEKVGEVFFESGEFRISSSEYERLKNQMANFDGAELVLVGSADRVGGEFFNATLSLLRATSVQRELETLLNQQISFVSVDGVGELGAPVKTSDGTPEDLNRWVGIFAVKR